jgi:hypothetical protein
VDIFDSFDCVKLLGRDTVREQQNAAGVRRTDEDCSELDKLLDRVSGKVS